MPVDHLKEAVLFLRGALERIDNNMPVDRFSIERAIEEIEAAVAEEKDR